MVSNNDILELRMRDIDRLKVMQYLIEGRLKVRQACRQLNLSSRQVLRLKKRFKREGPRALVHGLRGHPSNHRLTPSTVERAIALLRQPDYAGFGPTLALEKLPKDIRLSIWSLRQAMIQKGLWKARRSTERHRAWRPRRDCLGELLQVDGSEHDWFEGRAQRCWLIAYIDDATSRLMHAEFVDAEDTVTLMRLTGTYLKTHGRPLAFYVDKDSIYKTNRKATVHEELHDLYPITQFTRAMEELGIQVICADSPQAKGRVERLFNTLQDRLVKELRLRHISTKEEANRFLWEVYIPDHNVRFAIAPANTTDAHRHLLKTHRLTEILSLRAERTLANDWTVRFNNQYFQILPRQGIRPPQTLEVEVRLNGVVHLRFKGRYLRYKRIERPLPKVASPQTAVDRFLRNLMAKKKPWRPAATHPWRRYKGGTQVALLNAARATTTT